MVCVPTQPGGLLHPRPTSDHPSIHPRALPGGVGSGPRPGKKTPLSPAHNDHEGVPGAGCGAPRWRCPTIPSKRGHRALPIPHPQQPHKGRPGLGRGRRGGDAQAARGCTDAHARVSGWPTEAAPRGPPEGSPGHRAGGGAFVPHVEPAGPPSGTPPAPRRAARPRAARRGAPPARDHVRRPPAQLRGPGAPQAGVTPATIAHTPRCGPTRGPAHTRPRLHGSGRGHPAARRPPTGPKSPATHLHDAVRGLGCRHLHPSPPASETPPFFSLPPDRGPPFTRGSTARPPRPRHKSLLARKAVHLEASHCHWMVCPSIKPQVPAPPRVQRTIPSWRLGREQLPVYLNQCA